MAVNSEAAGVNGEKPGAFATTRWSVILASGDSKAPEQQRREALAELCRSYWHPIYAFICRRGYPPADAQDLTQDFFVNLLEGNLLAVADPGRSRFRSLLLKALQDFLVDASRRTNALKRGGGQRIVEWEEWMAEAPSSVGLSSAKTAQWSAEKVFDWRWAATLAEQALRRLGTECEQRGRRRLFDVLSKHLTADRADVSYDELARVLGVSQPAVKNAIHRMRARYADLLREEVAQTVDDKSLLEEELRYLCAVLATAT